MTYLDKRQDVDEKECQQCDYSGDVEVITEYEGRFVMTTWTCPVCGYSETNNDYDDDEELGFSPDDWNDARREEWS